MEKLRWSHVYVRKWHLLLVLRLTKQTVKEIKRENSRKKKQREKLRKTHPNF